MMFENAKYLISNDCSAEEKKKGVNMNDESSCMIIILISYKRILLQYIILV